ncbi:MAG: hypothetical protein JNL80_15810 [Phycisphaerae bacterium]|jgi:hypothetical protein|nr:hypothetical protein [Phycisphaerae bacterium]
MTLSATSTQAARSDTAEALRIGFENDAVGTLPSGWTAGSTLGGASKGSDAGWRCEVTAANAFGGSKSLAISAPANARDDSGAPSWTTDATPFRDSAIRVTLRTRADAGPIVTLTIARPGHSRGFNGLLIAGEPDARGWRTFTIDAGVAADATSMTLAIQPDASPKALPISLDDLEVQSVARLSERPYELRFIAGSLLDAPNIAPFALRSQALSAFAGRDVVMHAAVVAPPGADLATLPICYTIHGFGGNHTAAWRSGPGLLAEMAGQPARNFVHVFLDGSCELGHHEFADSANNGPWGEALVHELIPAIERAHGGERLQGMRFVRGHSSGGWSALWLQVTYPDRFGGCWASAPDPVDFRDFSGIDLFRDRNMYRDDAGRERPLVVNGDTTLETVERYVRGEMAVGAFGGQLASFEAVFSPRGDDGKPKRLFDRATGEIDRNLVEAWKRYDIGHLLRSRWTELAPKLRGKLHVWCGDNDTFRLDGAVRLLKRDLAELGSDADILLVQGRNHGSLFNAHETLWPEGMLARQQREMEAAARRSATSHSLR